MGDWDADYVEGGKVTLASKPDDPPPDCTMIRGVILSSRKGRVIFLPLEVLGGESRTCKRIKPGLWRLQATSKGKKEGNKWGVRPLFEGFADVCIGQPMSMSSPKGREYQAFLPCTAHIRLSATTPDEKYPTARTFLNIEEAFPNQDIGALAGFVADGLISHLARVMKYPPECWRPDSLAVACSDSSYAGDAICFFEINGPSDSSHFTRLLPQSTNQMIKFVPDPKADRDALALVGATIGGDPKNGFTPGMRNVNFLYQFRDPHTGKRGRRQLLLTAWADVLPLCTSTEMFARIAPTVFSRWSFGVYGTISSKSIGYDDSTPAQVTVRQFRFRPVYVPVTEEHAEALTRALKKKHGTVSRDAPADAQASWSKMPPDVLCLTHNRTLEADESHTYKYGVFFAASHFAKPPLRMDSADEKELAEIVRPDEYEKYEKELYSIRDPEEGARRVTLDFVMAHPPHTVMVLAIRQQTAPEAVNKMVQECIPPEFAASVEVAEAAEEAVAEPAEAPLQAEPEPEAEPESNGHKRKRTEEPEEEENARKRKRRNKH